VDAVEAALATPLGSTLAWLEAARPRLARQLHSVEIEPFAEIWRTPAR
jgi:hypothetical protein